MNMRLFFIIYFFIIGGLVAQDPVSLLFIRVNGKYGLINRSGKIVIEPRFDAISKPSEGIFKVNIGGFTMVLSPLAPPAERPTDLRDGKWGFIDTSGILILEPQFDFVGSFYHGAATISQGALDGLIDRKGRILFPPQYNEIVPFSDSLLQVRKDKLFALMNFSGEIVSSWNLMRFKEPRIKIQSDPIKKDSSFKAFQVNGRWGMRNNRGDTILAAQFDFVSQVSGNLIRYRVGKSYGLADSDGRIITSAKYDFIGSSFDEQGRSYIGKPFEKIVAVEVKGKIGYVDTSGREIIPAKFYSAFPFENDRAIVSEELQKGVRFGVIDTRGRYIIGPEYARIERFDQKFFLVGQGPDDYLKYGLADTSGAWVVPIQYFSILPFSEGRSAVVTKKGFGYIDENARLVIEPQFTDALDFKNGVAAVAIGNAWGYVDPNGRWIWKPTK